MVPPAPNAVRHICLITSGHIASNPRLVKEACALTEAGFLVSIVSYRVLPGAVQFDRDILNENPSWQFHPVDWFAWKAIKLLFKGLHLLARKTAEYLPLRWWKDIAFHQSVLPLWLKARPIQADLYIGHNLAALPVVSWLATRYNKPFGFDLEDAHSIEAAQTAEQAEPWAAGVEKRYLPRASYLTAASPLFVEYYRRTVSPDLNIRPILNVFPRYDPSPLQLRDRTDRTRLSLYWFSQTIGEKRGLEAVFLALDQLNRRDIELFLRGSCTPAYKNHLLGLISSEVVRARIHFLPKISPVELPFRHAEHDIGLALEQKDLLNRNYCLTNKLFEYFLAGLAVIATDTAAQKMILDDDPAVGWLIDQDRVDKLAILLGYLADNPSVVSAAKKAALEAAHERYNWELEKHKFLEIIQNIIPHAKNTGRVHQNQH